MLPELSRDEILRYSRHLLIPEVGLEGQRAVGARDAARAVHQRDPLGQGVEGGLPLFLASSEQALRWQRMASR